MNTFHYVTIRELIKKSISNRFGEQKQLSSSESMVENPQFTCLYIRTESDTTLSTHNAGQYNIKLLAFRIPNYTPPWSLTDFPACTASQLHFHVTCLLFIKSNIFFLSSQKDDEVVDDSPSASASQSFLPTVKQQTARTAELHDECSKLQAVVEQMVMLYSTLFN